MSDGTIEADHIVCANAYRGTLCGQEDTIVNAYNVGDVLHGKCFVLYRTWEILVGRIGEFAEL